MNLLSFGDIRNPPSTLPARINLCGTDPRFKDAVNRTLEWLMACGNFQGTTAHVHLCLDGPCFVTPPFVATVNAVHACGQATRIENNWYSLLPGFNPNWETGEVWFQYVDNVPSFASLCAARVLRFFVVATTDKGKTAKVLGYDKNKQWVRTLQNGTMQDGEVVTLNTPFVDTVTEWTSVTQMIFTERDGLVTVFSHPFGDDTLTPFGSYQYWETKPSYQRFRVKNSKLLDEGCCSRNVVSAEVKLCYTPVKNDDDMLPIQNRIAFEMAVMGVKALDDGDLARSDLLLFGDGKNQRIGAIPLLNQEIRTNTNDRFAANVRIDGPCGFRSIMRGFI